MIAFFWLQREVDILSRLAWSQYRPADAPDLVRTRHHKTGVPIDMPLLDDDGSDLWPELTARLDACERRGTLIVTRDTPDRFKQVHLPWKKRHFLRTVSKIRKAAGIDPAIKFMGLRHGGNTEGGDANLTDAQLRALSGHKTASMTQLYTKRTVQQRREAARKRRDSRTKGGQLSE
jgi:integrase